MSKIIGITAATTIKPESNGGGIKLEAAQVGQTIVVKAVDENGKPTEWEAVDFPECDMEISEVSSPDEIPADAEDGSMWVAPKQESEESTGGGGLPVVELETLAPLDDFTTMSDADISKVAAIGRNLFIARVKVENMDFDDPLIFTLLMGYAYTQNRISTHYYGSCKYYDRSYFIEIWDGYISAARTDLSV